MEKSYKQSESKMGGGPPDMIPSADMILHISLGLIALGLMAAAVFIVQRRFTTGQQASTRTDSPNEGFFTDRAEGQGPEQLPTSRRYARAGLVILAALFLPAALGGRFWYMPVSVPPEVLQEAHSERPTSLQPTSVQQSASPLHWRMQIRGRLSSGSDDQPAPVFTYTVSRLTGDSHTSLSSAQPGGEMLLGLVVVVSARILGYMACTTIARLLGRPCPECGSRPFRLLEENELMSERSICTRSVRDITAATPVGLTRSRSTGAHAFTIGLPPRAPRDTPILTEITNSASPLRRRH